MKLLKAIWKAIKSAFAADMGEIKPVEQKPVDPVNEEKNNEVAKLSDQQKIYAVAKSQLGVKESLVGSNPVIEKYHAFATESNKNGTTDDVPWCSSFACYCTEMAGFRSTNSKAARSWLKWGLVIKEPVEGDIVVFWRESKSSSKGHVAFFVKFDSKGNVVCLGGNQSNQVCIATYSKDQLLGFRRV